MLLYAYGFDLIFVTVDSLQHLDFCAKKVIIAPRCCWERKYSASPHIFLNIPCFRKEVLISFISRQLLCCPSFP